MGVQQVAAPIPATALLPGSMTGAGVNDERLLVAKAQSGNVGAFGELYERLRTRIYHTAFRILRNADDAEDAVQRSFQRAFTNLGKFRGESAFSTWMTRIAVNDALMMLRQRRAGVQIVEESSGGEQESSAIALADNGPTPEETLSANEVRDVVTHAISRLRKSLRTVVVLRELQGLTSAETARRLGLTVSAVKARTFHARRHLRRHLEQRLRAARNGCSSNTSEPSWALLGSRHAERGERKAKS
jgi:RNA polymerase sigma-70 factor (ECF subfamily)